MQSLNTIKTFLYIHSNSQLGWCGESRACPWCGRLCRDIRGERRVVARDMFAQASRDGNLPEELHSRQGPVERRSCGGWVYTSAAGVVGDMEETVCGRKAMSMICFSLIRNQRHLVRASSRYQTRRSTSLSTLFPGTWNLQVHNASESNSVAAREPPWTPQRHSNSGSDARSPDESHGEAGLGKPVSQVKRVEFIFYLNLITNLFVLKLKIFSSQYIGGDGRLHEEKKVLDFLTK